MKVPLAVLAALLLTLLLQPAPAQAKSSQSSRQTFTGCLTSANGLLLLQQPGGHAYALRGRSEELNKYIDKIIQVQGTPEKPADTHVIGAALRVKSYKVEGECRLNLKSLSRADDAWKKSGEPAVPIAGKTGNESAAVPVTSNRSVGETTPPFYVRRNQIPPPPSPAGQPPVAEDTAQNPAAAERIAVGALRAEIGTRNGTVGVAAEPGAGTRASEQSPARFARVVKMTGEEFQPAKVTISAGQTVEWKNTTADPHTVTLVPDKALVGADAALPRNAQPFDSGTIGAGMSFRHTFTVPGTYRYYCTLHEGNGMVGEVIVR